MDHSGKTRPSLRMVKATEMTGFYVVVTGLDQDSKCQLLNAMHQGEQEAFTVLKCKTKMVIRKVKSYTISGQSVTLVQTPSLNTPAWKKEKEKLLTCKEWRNCKCVFVYVRAVQTTANDLEYINELAEEFGKDRVQGVTCYNTCEQHQWTSETTVSEKGGRFQHVFGINAPFKTKVYEAKTVLDKLQEYADVNKMPLPTELASEVDAKSKFSKDTDELTGRPVETTKCEDLIATVDVPSNTAFISEPSQPRKVEHLTQEDWNMFGHALKYGSARSNHVRVNVVGNHGVGKTTLVNRLLGKKIECPNPNPVQTENIDIHRYTARCEERNSKRQWQTGDHDTFMKELNIQRMAQAMIESKTSKLDESGIFSDLTLDDSLSPEEQISNNVDQSEVNPVFKLDFPSLQPVSLENIPDKRQPDILIGSDEIEDDFQTSSVSPFLRPKTSSQSNLSTLRGKEEYLRQVLFAKQDIEKKHYERIYFSYWDYAGQATYYETHQLFLSPSAVYLLLFDLSRNFDEIVTDNMTFRTGILKSCTIAEALKFWAQSIQAYTKDDYGGYAPFIVVGTHKAGLSETDIEKRFHEVRTLLNTNAECIAIDNTLDPDKDECLNKLKDKIIDNGLGVWDEKVSSQWVNLEYDMQKSHACQNGYIEFTKLQELDEKLDVPMCDIGRLESFLAHQHYRGNLLYYQHSRRKHLIITDPMLLVDFLNCLLRRKEPEKNQQHSGWNEDGILNHRFIMSSANEMNIEEYVCRAFRDILVNLNIIHPLLSSNQDENLDRYFLPCLLPDKPYTEQDDDECTRSPLFQIQFDCNSIHQTTYHQIICALLKCLPLIEEDGETLIHNLHACFDVKEDRFVWLVIFWKNSKINFTIKNFNQDNMMRQYVEEVIEKLEEAIEDVLCANHHKNVSYSFHVECPKHQKRFLKLEHLKAKGKALCSGLKTVREGGRHVVNITDLKFVNAACDKQEDPMLLERPTDKMLARLAWKLHKKETPTTLTVRLKLPGACSGSDIVSRDYCDPGSELFQVLYEWRNYRETNRTYQKLLNLFTKRKDYDMNTLKTAMFLPQITGFQPESIPEHAAVHNRDISIFSRNIGNGYTFVLLECGIAWYRIQQVRRDHRDDTREMIRQLLCEWRKDNPEHSTTNKLLEAAWLYDVPLDGTISELQQLQHINP